MKEDATFYFIVWAILLIVALLERLRKKPFNTLFITVVLMMAAVIVACRVEVGADWDSYKFIFYNGYDVTGRDSTIIEPIFMLIRSLFFYLGFTHAVFFIFLSIVSLFAIRKAAELYGVKFFMTVFLAYYSMFFLSYQFNIVRHGLMASFVWLSFAFKSKGEIRAAVISIVVATGFHYLALFFVPFLFLLDRKISKPIALTILAISYLAYFGDVSSRVMTSFPFLFEMERVAALVSQEEHIMNRGLPIGSQIQVFLFLLLFFKYNASYKTHPGLRILVNSLLLNFLILCSLNSFYAILSRLWNVLLMANIFLLPLFIEKLKKPTSRLVVESLFFVYMFISLPKTFAIHEDGYSEMLPYKFDIGQLFDKNV